MLAKRIRRHEFHIESSGIIRSEKDIARLEVEEVVRVPGERGLDTARGSSATIRNVETPGFEDRRSRREGRVSGEIRPTAGGAITRRDAYQEPFGVVLQDILSRSIEDAVVGELDPPVSPEMKLEGRSSGGGDDQVFAGEGVDLVPGEDDQIASQ